MLVNHKEKRFNKKSLSSVEPPQWQQKLFHLGTNTVTLGLVMVTDSANSDIRPVGCTIYSNR